jgi:hypothetical protein
LAAAAVFPIIAGLLPDIVSLIAGLVHPKAIAAEAAHGPLSGPVKFADVFASTMKDLIAAHAAGTIPLLPDEPMVKIVIQAVVTTMKLGGLLGDSAAVAVPPAAQQQIRLKAVAGQSLLISVVA